jgi:hypothetical protein
MKAEMHAEEARREDLFERYSRMLQTGDTDAAFYVIQAARTDKVADAAVRLHIATLLDQGRSSELTTQLLAYAVKCLVP